MVKRLIAAAAQIAASTQNGTAWPARVKRNSLWGSATGIAASVEGARPHASAGVFWVAWPGRVGLVWDEMKSMALPLVLGVLFPLTAPLSARTWTNAEGREIEAEYVSSDGEKVVLLLNGKEIPYPLEKLSEADREWVEKQEADGAEEAPDTPGDTDDSGVETGYRPDLPITARLFPDLDGYCRDRTRREVFLAFEDGAFADAPTGNDDPERWMARDPEKDRYNLYVPASYDGSEPYGLYLHIAPSDGGNYPPAWHAVFDERKMIAVSARAVGNGVPMMRRVTLSVDAMETVMKDHIVDSKRCVVGGLSGGGHMAMLTAAMFPERFAGAVSHAAQSYLPGDSGGSHFPGMDLRDFGRSPRDELKWVVISGDKDKNYGEIQKTSELWLEEKLSYRFIDVPGMGHVNAAPEDFAKALDWIFE